VNWDSSKGGSQKKLDELHWAITTQDGIGIAVNSLVSWGAAV